MCDVREFRMTDGECRVHSRFYCAACGYHNQGIAAMTYHDDRAHGGARVTWVPQTIWDYSPGASGLSDL